jgi:predicted RNA-binding Zn-ribbon protein involved in translation (DUF1610 family)
MFSGSLDPTHLVCGIHPLGPSESPCPDFAEVPEDCMPLGAAYYDGELVLQAEHYLSTEERLKILNTHPFFTGVCPKCGMAIASHQESAGEGIVHYDCPECDFRDDSVV